MSTFAIEEVYQAACCAVMSSLDSDKPAALFIAEARLKVLANAGIAQGTIGDDELKKKWAAALKGIKAKLLLEVMET